MTNLRKQMDVGKMSRYQWGTSALCILLNVSDGFDILVIAYIATSLTDDWGLSGTEVGLLMSAGLVGMALGTMFLSPLADKIGRRPLLLFCMTLAGAGMILSAFAPEIGSLIIIRLITGVGMGGIIVSAGVIASEFASQRWRGLAVSLNSVGYAFGAVLAGLVSVWVLSFTSWRGVFLVGGISTFLLLAVLIVRMPESVDYLYLGKSRNSLERINSLAEKMNKEPVTNLDIQAEESKQRETKVTTVLTSPKYRWPTILLCIAFFMLMVGYYFVQSWTPALLVESGFSETQGNIGGTILNVGAMLGAICVGILLARYALKNVLVTAFVLTTCLMIAYAVLPTSLIGAFIASLVIGTLASGSMAGMYALATGAYEASVRSTAMGLGLTVGRIGAIAAPAMAGSLLDLGWGTAGLYILIAPSFLIAGLAVAMFKLQIKDARSRTPGPSKVDA